MNVTFAAPVTSRSFQATRSLSGMVSSVVGASMAMVVADRPLPKGMPAASISRRVCSKI